MLTHNSEDILQIIKEKEKKNHKNKRIKTNHRNTVHLAHPVTKIRLPARTSHTSGAKSGSRCEAYAYSVIYYSVFLFLRRVIYKLSSEVGCREVNNPKQPVRERDRQSPTALHVTTCASMLKLGQCYFIATQQFAERSELGKLQARMSNCHRHRQVVYCLIGQSRFNLTPLPLDSMRTT